MRKLVAIGFVSALVIGSIWMAPSVGAATRITGMSHTHPEGESFSYVCAKVKGRVGTRFVAMATGPAVVNDTVRFKMPQKGVKKVVFEIEAAGEYTVKVRRANRNRVLASESYDVPSPPPGGAAQGPFPCVG
jgi:hypothetical protein